VSPCGWVVRVLLAFAAVWLLACAVTSLSPPVDNLEQLTWSHSLEWGYYKHPPLTTALAWLAVQVLGRHAWTTYLLGATLTLSAMALFWRLLRDVRGAHHANVALLAGLCITFYNGRLYYFNHNVVLLLLVTAAATACWRAFRQRTWGAWAWVGVVFGLGALAKYQIAVTALSAFVFWLSQRGWRDPVHRGGALLAVLIALLLFTPHLLWLPQHGFAPIDYALGSSLDAQLPLGDRFSGAVNWLADELLNRAGPAFLLLALVWTLGARRASPPVRRSPAARALLLSWGLTPLVFMPLVGLLSGAELQLQWGTPFLLFAVPCAMELVPVDWNAASPRQALRIFVGVQALLLTVFLATSPAIVPAWPHRYWNAFSSAEFAARVGPLAERALGHPVRVIVGPQGEGGALALHLPGDPLLLLDGRYDRSPWVAPDLVDACGAVALLHSSTPPSGWMPVGPPFLSQYWRVIPPRLHRACEQRR
jgi:4-amino-4-deoxy-L-arabinose transferase-like glycosyltransferase